VIASRLFCWTAICAAIIGAGTPARAQQPPLPDDSSLVVSAGVRSWLGTHGLVSSPAVNATLRWRSRFGRAAADIGAVARSRDGSGFAIPYVLDGSLRVESAPLNMNGLRLDVLGGLRRDAFDLTRAWVQGSAGGRVWLGSVLQGAEIRVEHFRPFGAKAMPGATEYETGFWRQIRGMRFTVGVRRTQTTQLVPLTNDSAGVDLDVCVLDYDARRPLRQYQTTCPRNLQANDVGASVEHSGDRHAMRFFLGHRYGRADYGASSEAWFGLSVERRIAPRLALSLGAERRPTEIVRGVPAHNRFTIGFRSFPLVANIRRAESPPRAEAPVRVARHLVLDVPRAKTVEVRGDLTDWRITTLVPERNGTWRLPRELRPGRYLVEMRVDGGEWHAPPGLPTTSDGFGGTVGVLIVDSG
jgi:hypothetical protein